MDLSVTKTSGLAEEFNPEKLYSSLRKAGVDSELATHVSEEVGRAIKPGDSTHKIFKETFKHLLKGDLEMAARYALERAVNSLGPAGFMFEQYVEAMLQTLGYSTERNVFVDGQCVTHEIDILAEKENNVFLVEAKYRNGHKVKTHIDQVMYADSRLEDIKRKAVQENSEKKYDMLVVTNAYFTTNSIQYAECRGIRLLGWKHPKEENLMSIAEKHKLYPITVLPSLNTYALEKLAQNQIILLRDILPYSSQEIQGKFGISANMADNIYSETQAILKAYK